MADPAASVAIVGTAAGALQLRLANDIGAVAAALPCVQGFARDAELPPRLANRLEVVFEELASNPIRHGFTPGSGQSLSVSLTARPDGVRLEFEDDGPPFDPLARAAPPALDRLDTAPEGGLGIALVRRLASRFVREQPPRLPGMINRIVVELPRG
ncbi:MAG: ATP-binding protein [Sphingomonadales bacterium]|jgi:anti-sigma regulatory factor (Ser/Thr protein kinase)